MSLLFEDAVGAFTPDDASHVAPDESGLRTVRDDPLPLESVYRHASNRPQLNHPVKENWTCIPLHESDSARLTGEYIVYTDHTVRGELILYQSETQDSVENIEIEPFGRTPLAERIRFWHSDFIPTDTPDYFTGELQPIEPPEHPLSEPDATQFFDSIETAIEREREAARDSNYDQARGLSARALYNRGGDAIPSLDARGESANGTYRFRVTTEKNFETFDEDSLQWYVRIEFGIYEGNEVLLRPPTDVHPPDAFPIRATVTGLTNQFVQLRPAWSSIVSTERPRVERFLDRNHDDFGLSSLLNPIPYDRQGEALIRVRAGSFADVLTGRRGLGFDGTLGANSSPNDEQLNQEQELAVTHALAAEDLFCIHGPPGTGKTRTLIEIVRRATEANARVLVCADSNQAVDNMVVGTSIPDEPDERSLHAHAQFHDDEFRLSRVKAENSDSDLVGRFYAEENPEHADVVAATNNSAATLTTSFDLVVIDEATQASIPSSMIPLSKVDRAVLAGDHHQLPPFRAATQPTTDLHGRSLFEHLYAENGVYEDIGVQLTTQYRMHPDIAWFSNRRFYEGSLKTGQPITPIDEDPIIGVNIGGGERSENHSTANATEARMIAYLADQLVSENGINRRDIGVITPYRAQVRAIQDHLSESIERSHAITVDTIDSFQGSEKEAIIISLVRSNGDGRIGFLGREDGPRRLNVAITRAQSYCAVVGDWETLRYESQEKLCGDLYEKLYDYLDDTGRMQQVDPEFIPV